MNIDSYEKSCRNSAKVSILLSKINVSLEAEKNSSNVDSNFLPLCVAGHMPSASPLGLPTKKTNNVIITSYILSLHHIIAVSELWSAH